MLEGRAKAEAVLFLKLEAYKVCQALLRSAPKGHVVQEQGRSLLFKSRKAVRLRTVDTAMRLR